MRKIFVTGIDTGVGKTVISSIIVEALKADYWKPVQTGDFLTTDKIKVRNLISNNKSRFHDEVYSFAEHMSPHAAAALAGATIDCSKFVLPDTDNTLVIEGAGGVMVPLTDQCLLIDVMKKLDVEVVIVANNYLGSINHTLLTWEALKNRGCKILGIIFNGAPNESSEDYILKYTGLKCLLRKYQEDKITREEILKYSKMLKL